MRGKEKERGEREGTRGGERERGGLNKGWGERERER